MASSVEAIDMIEVEPSSISSKITVPAMHSKEIDFEETGIYCYRKASCPKSIRL